VTNGMLLNPFLFSRSASAAMVHCCSSLRSQVTRPWLVINGCDSINAAKSKMCFFDATLLFPMFIDKLVLGPCQCLVEVCRCEQPIGMLAGARDSRRDSSLGPSASNNVSPAAEQWDWSD
jgi:hypothetical protein